MVIPMDENLSSMFAKLKSYLGVRLPEYMVPSIYVNLHYVPFITSLKADRAVLRNATSPAKMDTETLARHMLANVTKEAPVGEREVIMQGLWADVLRVSPDVVGRNDSFLALGGDSLAAIRLVTKAREQGIGLTVGSIFRDPRLSQVAEAADFDQDGAAGLESQASVEPWSLVPADQQDTLLAVARRQCNLRDSDGIQDLYPVTALQEGLMALTARQPGAYISKYMFKLRAGADVNRFKAAWEQTFAAIDALRTRLVLYNNQTWQVKVDEQPDWLPTAKLSSYETPAEVAAMTYGTRLCVYAMVEAEDGSHYFTLMMHHSIFDGWCFGLIVQTLSDFYEGTSQATSLVPFANFINFTLRLDENAGPEYWTNALRGATRAVWPRTPRKTPAAIKQKEEEGKEGEEDKEKEEEDTSGQYLAHDIPLRKTSNTSGVTMATVLRAAWALLLGRYNDDADDITFAATVTGRQTPVSGIDRMVGPAISTVPVRTSLAKTRGVSEFLNHLHHQATEMIPYEQMGLQNIAKLGADMREACDVSTLLVIQPAKLFQETTEDSLLTVQNLAADGLFKNYFTYPLVAQIHLGPDNATLHLVYDSSAVSAAQAGRMARQYASVVDQLLTHSKQDTINDIRFTSAADVEEIRQWHSKLEPMSAVEECVHKIISQQAADAPDRQAIFAWDGSCTYRELDEMTDALASHLIEKGVGVESFVPVCFEKSIWAVVAMVAILKAGGAYVPLSPEHPLSRRQKLVGKVKAPVVMTSPESMGVCQDIGAPLVIVTGDLIKSLTDGGSTQQRPRVPVRPDNASYMLFTSGTTGEPKGVIGEHHALATGCIRLAERLGLKAESRMLQFSNYIYDVSVSEIFASLVVGATVCIPSEAERVNYMESFINRAQAGFAMLRPAADAQLQQRQPLPGGEARRHCLPR
jgi:non-ribosomal peptide synthetase component F/aryl carrier-like protein